MKRIFFTLLALALVAGITYSTSIAQGAPQGGPGGPGGQGMGGQGRGGGGGGRAAAPQQIDLATAKKLIAAVEAAATAKNDHVAITVMDARGDMAAFERMDTLDNIPAGTSQGKAHAVLEFGLPTGVIADDMRQGKPVPATIKAPMAGAENISLMRGGLPIMKDGKMVGSLACGGSSTESDEALCQAGLDAVFPKQ